MKTEIALADALERVVDEGSDSKFSRMASGDAVVLVVRGNSNTLALAHVAFLGWCIANGETYRREESRNRMLEEGAPLSVVAAIRSGDDDELRAVAFQAMDAITLPTKLS